jgi:hypothetical protein
LSESIRNCKTDIEEIAKNLNLMPETVERVKNHLYYKKHILNSYDNEIEFKRFDADLKQSLVWKALQRGQYNDNDREWFNHELLEMYHISKNPELGYSDAHKKAESWFKGRPWQDTDLSKLDLSY